jgi:hypothetical protein
VVQAVALSANPGAVSGSASGSGATSADGGRSGVPAGASAGTAGTSSGTAGAYLADLPVELGTANARTAPPTGYAGPAGYDHPIFIGCATGQPRDQFREVSYSLRQRYRSLTATIVAYKGAPDEARVQVRFYPDTQPPVERNLTVGTSTELTLSLVTIDTLRVRVTCEAPDASAILSGAWLTHM